MIPAKPHIEQFTADWLAAFIARAPAIWEKSRRTTISWTARGLETWLMGRSRGTWLIVDQKHENSAAHLWRIHFALGQLGQRRPELAVAPHRAFGRLALGMASAIVLANGSILTESHQDAGAAQGRGRTGVTLEELSKYKDPEGFWGQALIISRGGAGGDGGWVNAIANPSLSPKWRDLKGGVNPRALLGWE